MIDAEENGLVCWFSSVRQGPSEKAMSQYEILSWDLKASVQSSDQD